MGNLKFYKDEPLFGLDIGHTSLKVMQVSAAPGKPRTITGYGFAEFDPAAIQNGVITKPEAIAAAMHNLFDKRLVGAITSRRVACSLPTSRTFSRPMRIPLMDHGAIVEAIHLEAEQYIPVPINSLYLDYEITGQDDKQMELLLVAISREIVDSYQRTLEALDLEPVAFEPGISAASRLLGLGRPAGEPPAVIVDIGSAAADIAVFDKTLLVTSTVNSSGDSITAAIAQNFHLAPAQAAELRNKEGISFSDKQQRIIDAIKPQLEALVREIQKSIRYYSERAAQSGRKISQIITVGGGSVMPGLNQYISQELRLPAETLEPWGQISFGRLAAPGDRDKAMYIIVAGEAIVDPAEVLA